MLEARRVVVRYRQFYGPDTSSDQPPPSPRIHIDDAARRTLPALKRAATVVTLIED